MEPAAAGLGAAGYMGARAGIGMAAGAVGGAARGGAALAGGARTAYGLADSSLGSTGSDPYGFAFAGVAKAGAGLFVNKGREAAGRAAESMRSSYRSGQAVAWKATGGKNDVNPGHADAANDADGADAQSSAAASGAAQQSPPDWAKRMKRGSTVHHGVSTTAHTVRSGDHGGGSMSVNLNQDDRK